jgi:hypothetical protein
MRRADLEHLVAAAANIVGEDDFVVIGSQALLATTPDADGELVISMELDLYPRHSPEKADSIDGALGDGSRFHETFGYYAHGVGAETAVLPAGWQDRLIAVPIPPRVRSERSPIAYCPEPHDLVLSKCVAGRERDWTFAETAITQGIVQPAALLERVDHLPVAAAKRRSIRLTLEAIAERGRTTA